MQTKRNRKKKLEIDYPALPVLLGVDTSVKLFLLITLCYGIEWSNSTLYNFLTLKGHYTVEQTCSINIIVVMKQFQSGVSKDSVLRKASILRMLWHPTLPVVLGFDTSVKLLLLIPLFYGIKRSNTTLYNILTLKGSYTIEKTCLNNIIRKMCEALEYLQNRYSPLWHQKRQCRVKRHVW